MNKSLTPILNQTLLIVDDIPLMVAIRARIQKIEDNPSLVAALEESVLKGVEGILQGILAPYGIYKALKKE